MSVALDVAMAWSAAGATAPSPRRASWSQPDRNFCGGPCRRREGLGRLLENWRCGEVSQRDQDSCATGVVTQRADIGGHDSLASAALDRHLEDAATFELPARSWDTRSVVVALAEPSFGTHVASQNYDACEAEVRSVKSSETRT